MQRLLMAGVLASVSFVAQANTTFGVIPQAGLAGVGATVQWGFTPYLAVSAGYTGLNYSLKDVKTDDATYNGDINLQNPQLFLNWAPFGGHFKVSVGTINQQTDFDLTADDYTDPDSGNKVRVNVSGGYAQSVAPALTVGFESDWTQPGFGYHFSLGGMYAGKPDVDVDIQCTNPAGTCFGLERDEERKLEDELKKYQVLPILQAGLIFRM